MSLRVRTIEEFRCKSL